MKNIDVINKTPKENEFLIRTEAERELFIDKLFIVWAFSVLQITPFGFLQLFSADVQFVFYVMAICFSIFLGVYFLIFGEPGVTDRYVNNDQYQELKNLSKQNSIVSKYLFFVRLAKRPVYLAEYQELISIV